MSEQKLNPGTFGWGAPDLAIPKRRIAATDHSIQSSQQLLEVMSALVATNSIPPVAIDSLRSKLKEQSRLKLAFQAISADEQKVLSEKIGERVLGEILAMSDEPDAAMFHHNLLHLGVRLKVESDYDKATVVLGMISQGAVSAVPESIRLRAESEFNAIVGKGAFGKRFEVLSDRFADDSTDWRMIVPMLGASTLGHLVGTAALGKLLTLGGESWYSRGFGARAVAAFAGYGAETFAFALGNRAVAPHPTGPFIDDLERAGIAIASLKGTAWLGNQIFLKLHGFNEFGVPARLAGLARFNQAAIPQFSMFTGMMASHKIETRLGLRPHTDDATLVTDTLSSMLSLGIGMHGASRMLGPGYRALQTELAMRAETYGRLAQGPGPLALGEAVKKFQESFQTQHFMAATGPGGLSMAMSVSDLEGAGHHPAGGDSPRAMMAKVEKKIPSASGSWHPFKLVLTREAERLFGSAHDSSLAGKIIPIGEREGRTLSVEVEKVARVTVGDPITPEGVTKVNLQIREGDTRGKAFVFFDEKSVTLYFIDLEETRITGGPPMQPGAGSVFLSWVAEQAKLQGKSFNVTRITNPQMVKIIERQGLMDPETARVEACTRIDPQSYDEEYRVEADFKMADPAQWEIQGRNTDFFNIFGAVPARRERPIVGPSIAELIKVTPSQREIRERGGTPPLVNPLGLSHTMDGLLNHWVQEGTTFLELGYGEHYETMVAAARRGARALGLELNGAFPSGMSKAQIEGEPIDLLFLSQHNSVYFKQEKVSIPSQRDILAKAATARRVMIQSYDPRSGLEILRHAEKTHGVEYRVLYFQGKPFTEEGPVFPSDYGKSSESYNTVLVAERVDARFSEINTKQVVATPKVKEEPIPLSRQLAVDISRLQEQVRQLPEGNPLKAKLEEVAIQIEKDGFLPSAEHEFHRKLGLLELQLGEAWSEALEQRLQTCGDLVREIAASSTDPDLTQRVEKFFAPKPFVERDYLFIKREFGEFSSLLLDSVSAMLKQQWGTLSKNEVPPGLLQTVMPVMANVFRLDLIQSGFSAGALRSFSGELARFYHDYPPTSGLHLLNLTPADVALNRGLLQSNELSADGYLRGIEKNLAGYRRLFGRDAGYIFHGQHRLVSRLVGDDGQASPYYLALEKGQHEFANGLRLAFFLDDPKNLHRNAYLAKVGFNLDGDTLRLVNIQGPNKTYFLESEGKVLELQQLEAFLGGAGALDMLVAASILIARNAGFSKIEGVRDSAQFSRGKYQKNKTDKGFYDLVFRKFGFESPAVDADTWSLELPELRIHRKKGGDAPALSPQEYFHRVLVRKNRDEQGRNIRPEKWDRMAPDPSAPSVIAFWTSVAPAISELAYVRDISTSGPAPNYARSRPMRLGALNPSMDLAARRFYQDYASEPEDSDLAPPYEASFQQALELGAAGTGTSREVQIGLTRALQGDWTNELEALRPDKHVYSAREFLRERQLEGKELPAWAAEFRKKSSAAEADITEYTFGPDAMLRFNQEEQDQQRYRIFTFGVFRLLEEQLGFPKGSFIEWDKENEQKPVVLRVPSPQFLFDAIDRRIGDALPLVRAVPTSRLATEREMVEMLDADLRPLLFSRRHQDLHGEKGIHPYAVLLHDYYHLLRINRLPPESRAEASQLYRLMLSLKPTQALEAKFLGEQSELVVDGDPDGDPLPKVFFRQIPWTKFSAEFSSQLSAVLRTVFPEGERAERAYELIEDARGVAAFIHPLRDQLKTTPTVLSAESKKRFEGYLNAAAEQNLPIAATAPLLLDVLMTDYVSQLKSEGAVLRKVPPAVLKKVAPLLLGTQQARAAALQLREIHLSQESQLRLETRPESAQSLAFLCSVLRSLEVELGFPDSTLFSQDADGLTLRVPSTEFIFRGPVLVFGKQALRPRPASSLFSEAEYRDSLAVGGSPLLISSKSQDIHDFKGLHPYLAALHDAYHAIKLSRLPREMRLNLLRLHDVFTEHSASVSERELLEDIRKNLLDGNFGIEADFFPVFRHLANHAPSEQWVGALRQSLQRRFADVPGGVEILQAFERALLKTPPPPSGVKQGQSAALGGLSALTLVPGGKAKPHEARAGVATLETLENSAASASPLAGSEAVGLGLAMLLGMAFWRKPASKKQGPPVDSPQALKPAENSQNKLAVKASEAPGALARFRAEFDDNDVPYVMGSIPGLAMTLGELLAGFNFEHPLAFGLSVALSLLSGGKLLARRDRWQRLLGTNSHRDFSEDVASLNEGPYRSPGKTRLSELELQQVRELHLKVADEATNPYVRAEQVDALAELWLHIDEDHAEFFSVLETLAGLVRNPKVKRPLALMEEGMPVEPERTHQTMAANLTLRRHVFEAFDRMLAENNSDLVRQALAEALREAVVKPRLDKPSRFRGVLGIFSRGASPQSGVLTDMAFEAHGHGEDYLSKEMFLRYGDEVLKLPITHPERLKFYQLARSSKVLSLAQADEKFCAEIQQKILLGAVSGNSIVKENEAMLPLRVLEEEVEQTREAFQKISNPTKPPAQETPVQPSETVSPEPDDASVLMQKHQRVEIEPKNTEPPKQADLAQLEADEQAQAEWESLNKEVKRFSGRGPGGAALVALGLGLNAWLNPSQAWAGTHDPAASGSPLPWIGLGIAAGAGLGIVAYRWWSRRNAQLEMQERQANYWTPHLKLLQLPLDEAERELLAPLFPRGKAPLVLTGEDWRRIEKQVLQQAVQGQGESVLAADGAMLKLWDRVGDALRVIELQGKYAGKALDPNIENTGVFSWVTTLGKDGQVGIDLNHDEQLHLRGVFDRQGAQLLDVEVPERLHESNVLMLARLLLSEASHPQTESVLQKIESGFATSLRSQDPKLAEALKLRVKLKGGVPVPPTAAMLAFGVFTSTILDSKVDFSLQASPFMAPHSPAPWLIGGLAMAGWLGGKGLWDWVKGMARMEWNGLGFVRPGEEARPEKKLTTPKLPEPKAQHRKMPEGLFKKRMSEIQKILTDPKIVPGIKDAEVHSFVAQFFWNDWVEGPVGEMAKAVWDLSQDPRLSRDLQELAQDEHRAFLRKAEYFPPGAPQVYREALRLRRVFSNSRETLAKRIAAAEAYGELVERLNLETEIGNGEVRQGFQALNRLFEENREKVGRREIYPVLAVLKHLRQKTQPSQ